jgi:hypothetical protein
MVVNLTMKKIAIFTGCWIALIAASCSNEKKSAEQDEVTDEKLTEANAWNNDFVSVDNIMITDTIVWVYSEQNDEKLLYAYNINGRLLASGIGAGNGKDEVLELTSLHTDNHGIPTIYDGKSGKLYHVISDGNSLKLETFRDGLRLLDDAVSLANDATLALPTNSKISYALYDSNLTRIDSLSYFPPKPDGIDDNTHQLACTGQLTFSQDDNTFMRAVVYDGGLGFFKVEKNKVEFVNRFSLFDMNYGVLQASINLPIPNEKSQTGYAYVYATPKYFYASFSDAKADDNPEGIAKEVHVFDHQGKRVKRLLLDNEIGAFAVTADDKKLFAAQSNEDNTPIFIYQIP